MLSPEALAEFKQMYLKECGLNLTNEQAIYLGTQLIRLVKVVYGPNLPKKWEPRQEDGKIKERKK